MSLIPRHPNYSGSNPIHISGQFIEFGMDEQDNVMFIKLDSGYNAGFSLNRISDIKLLTRANDKVGPYEKKRSRNSRKPIFLISTGGTIASRLDYETGAVYPPQEPDDVMKWMESIDITEEVQPIISMSKLSEDMVPDDWMKLAKDVLDCFRSGARGCVITHGTDTLSYTACALSFLLRGLPGPVVLTGSQRSSDRPSTDAHQNLIDSILVARSGLIKEVCVVMHGRTSDGESLIHKGTNVRKMHTSARFAFASINQRPIGKVVNDKVSITSPSQKNHDDGELRVIGGFDPCVFLLKYHPQLNASMFDLLIENYKCIVLEGTGLGHVRSDLIPKLSQIVEGCIPIIMTSSCLNGIVNLNVYSTGRKLLESGIIPAYDMHPETAMIKAMYVMHQLGNIRTKDDMMVFRKEFLTNIAGEISYRTEIDLNNGPELSKYGTGEMI